jgi:hypothetical protein
MAPPPARLLLLLLGLWLPQFIEPKRLKPSENLLTRVHPGFLYACFSDGEGYGSDYKYSDYDDSGDYEETTYHSDYVPWTINEYVCTTLNLAYNDLIATIPSTIGLVEALESL